MPAGCYVDNANGPVQFKYSPGNVFPNEPNHGVKITGSPAQCCTLCQSFANCTFWNYEYGGSASQHTCYSQPGGCCFLKTDAAWPGTLMPGHPEITSGSTKPLPTPPPAGPMTVSVDWNSQIITTETAATVEVDVMPFLGEADWGGPFESYKKALGELDSEFVRFAPWFANPRVVVPELTPHVCSATQPSTNWNSTYFDGVMKDFMEAVCGPDAAKGTCTHSVVQQLSTMPEYMYVGGDTKPLPTYPWNTTDPFDAYKAGNALVDPTCKQMHGARFSTEVYSRGVPLRFTPLLRLKKRCHACGQWRSSRVSTFLTGSHCKLRPNTEGLDTLADLLGGTLTGGLPMNVDTSILLNSITIGGAFQC
jgi:hypothetical protein